MAKIIGISKWPGLSILSVDGDPSVDGGTPADQGTQAQVEGQAGIWIKDGPGDTDWTLSSSAGQFASLTNNSKVKISDSTVTPIAWDRVDVLDTSVFGLKVGGTDIEIKRSGLYNFRGQISVLFDSGQSNSRSKARGGLYIKNRYRWDLVPGTQGHGYHRQQSVGDDTIPLERTVRLNAGDVVRYGVQRVEGRAGLVFDPLGCSITISRKTS